MSLESILIRKVEGLEQAFKLLIEEMDDRMTLFHQILASQTAYHQSLIQRESSLTKEFLKPNISRREAILNLISETDESEKYYYNNDNKLNIPKDKTGNKTSRIDIINSSNENTTVTYPDDFQHSEENSDVLSTETVKFESPQLTDLELEEEIDRKIHTDDKDPLTIFPTEYNTQSADQIQITRSTINTTINTSVSTRLQNPTFFYCKEKDCELPFAFAQALEEHMSTVHDSTLQNSTEDQYDNSWVQMESDLICEICSVRFQDLVVYEKHILLEHGASHESSESVQCPLCHKQLSRSYISTHLRTHSNRKFRCSNCPSSYVNKADLKIHERSHTGEKPFECTNCPKAYADMRNLRRHMRSCIYRHSRLDNY